MYCMDYVRASDGTKIAVYDSNPRGRCTVLLVHGWPLSHKIFEYQENLLLEYGFRVVTLDLRGFGNSDAPEGGYCYDQMARDLYLVVKSLGLRNFVLGGFSMGGAIVLRYMKNYKGFGVVKLMLMAAAAPSFIQRPDFPYGVTPETVNRLIAQAGSDRPQLAWAFSHEQLFTKPKSAAVLRWFEDIALSASGVGTIQAAISLRDEDGRADLRCVHVPTIIFQGEQDLVVPMNLTMLQYECIPGARLCNLKNSGHGVMYDELERFNNCMMEFICS